MDKQHTEYPAALQSGYGGAAHRPEEHLLARPSQTPFSYPEPVEHAYDPAPPTTSYSTQLPDEPPLDSKSEPVKGRMEMLRSKKLSKKWQRRLYWLVTGPDSTLKFTLLTMGRIVPLCILALILVILFEVYKDDFERWVQPLADWLKKREAWSWVIPVVILFILSFPPLFGHEIVQIVVGVSQPCLPAA